MLICGSSLLHHLTHRCLDKPSVWPHKLCSTELYWTSQHSSRHVAFWLHLSQVRINSPNVAMWAVLHSHNWNINSTDNTHALERTNRPGETLAPGSWKKSCNYKLFTHNSASYTCTSVYQLQLKQLANQQEIFATILIIEWSFKSLSIRNAKYSVLQASQLWGFAGFLCVCFFVINGLFYQHIIYLLI